MAMQEKTTEVLEEMARKDLEKNRKIANTSVPFLHPTSMNLEFKGHKGNFRKSSNKQRGYLMKWSGCWEKLKAKKHRKREVALKNLPGSVIL